MSMNNWEKKEKQRRENALRGERKMKEPFLGMARNVLCRATQRVVCGGW